MSDLRARIVAVIEAQHVSEFQGGIHPEDVISLADAVIRELRLEVERGSTYEIGGKATSYRYVTDWIANE
jgi:hypothetical protein